MEKWEEQLKQYYAQQSLPASRVTRLLAQAEYVRPSWAARPIMSFSMAAVALLIAGTAMLWIWMGQSPNMTDRVATAIVTMHQHHLELEVVTDRYEVLQTKLDQLPFSLRPTSLVQQQFELVGGRYCYILEHVSAQLRLKKPNSDETYTLYITSLTPDLAPVTERTVHYNELEVKVWKDQNRLFGLAGPAPLSL